MASGSSSFPDKNQPLAAFATTVSGDVSGVSRAAKSKGFWPLPACPWL